MTLARIDDVTVGANLARIGDIDLDAVKMPKMGATPRRTRFKSLSLSTGLARSRPHLRQTPR